VDVDGRPRPGGKPSSTTTFHGYDPAQNLCGSIKRVPPSVASSRPEIALFVIVDVDVVVDGDGDVNEFSRKSRHTSPSPSRSTTTSTSTITLKQASPDGN
jgi:hypothetical protein